MLENREFGNQSVPIIGTLSLPNSPSPKLTPVQLYQTGSFQLYTMLCTVSIWLFLVTLKEVF